MRRMKKKFYTLLLTTFLITGTCAVCAENIPFNVTVGGSGAQDPLSKRKEKKDDNDNNAYYRATYVSNNKSGAYIEVKSFNLEKQYINTPQSTELSTANVGPTREREYNTTAPGGEYYFMKATTGGPRINVKGYYCP